LLCDRYDSTVTQNAIQVAQNQSLAGGKNDPTIGFLKTSRTDLGVGSGLMAAKGKSPLAVETAFRVSPVRSLRRETSVFGITASEASMTTPLIDPVVIWASIPLQNNPARIKAPRQAHHRLIGNISHSHFSQQIQR
jgi:hypothetical protein